MLAHSAALAPRLAGMELPPLPELADGEEPETKTKTIVAETIEAVRIVDLATQIVAEAAPKRRRPKKANGGLPVGAGEVTQADRDQEERQRAAREEVERRRKQAERDELARAEARLDKGRTVIVHSLFLPL